MHPGAVLGTQLAQALALKRGTHTAEEAADGVAAAAAAGKLPYALVPSYACSLKSRNTDSLAFLMSDAECYNASGCFFVHGVSTRCEFMPFVTSKCVIHVSCSSAHVHAAA